MQFVFDDETVKAEEKNEYSDNNIYEMNSVEEIVGRD
jgi:hypothetical protein